MPETQAVLQHSAAKTADLREFLAARGPGLVPDEAAEACSAQDPAGVLARRQGTGRTATERVFSLRLTLPAYAPGLLRADALHAGEAHPGPLLPRTTPARLAARTPWEEGTPVEGVPERGGALLRYSSMHAQALGTPRAPGSGPRPAGLGSGPRSRLSAGSSWATTERSADVAASDCARRASDGGEQPPQTGQSAGWRLRDYDPSPGLALREMQGGAEASVSGVAAVGGPLGSAPPPAQPKEGPAKQRLKRGRLQRNSLTGEGLQPEHGKRRSVRQHHRPLEWWRSEKKVYTRQYRSLPTVDHVELKDVDTPTWRFVKGTEAKRVGTAHHG
ncbi:hypothetical protein WJX81_008436 [Elliptochloris bilobata]|uniref:Uncharacterized protein n=1 Tax=Elliptochloris bilobata TaxID=381761 RepID=A0AAW1QW88_9CHLO